jgi:hypothetical protein
VELNRGIWRDIWRSLWNLSCHRPLDELWYQRVGHPPWSMGRIKQILKDIGNKKFQNNFVSFKITLKIVY